MKRNWQPSELIEHWTLLPNELTLLKGLTAPNRLGLAMMLKFYQYEGQFPTNKAEVPLQVIRYLAEQLKIDPNRLDNYDWAGRSIKAHRVKIRDFLGFREATLSDQNALKIWLEAQVLAYELKIESLLDAATTHLRQHKIEPPTPERLERLVRSVIHSFEEKLFSTIAQKIPMAVREKLDELLKTSPSELVEIAGSKKEQEAELSLENPYAQPTITILKTDPGRLGLDSWTKEADKLQQLRQLNLPSDLFPGISPKILEIYKQRVAVEAPRELRRHPDNRRYTLLSAFCWLRSSEITDNLVELLIQMVHRIGARAQRRVERELLDDFKKVSGKTGLLFQLAEAALSEPEGAVKEVIYPVVGETTLKNLVREFKSTGTAYREKVYTVMSKCSITAGGDQEVIAIEKRMALEDIK